MRIDDDGGPVYDIYGAVDYLRQFHPGVTYQGIKHHVYNTRSLVPDGRAGTVHPCFKQSTLDAFRTIPDVFKRGRRWYKHESEDETNVGEGETDM
jgi:hypothetical protein